MFVSPHALTSRAVWHITEKGWSSDFPPLPSEDYFLETHQFFRFILNIGGKKNKELSIIRNFTPKIKQILYNYDEANMKRAMLLIFVFLHLADLPCFFDLRSSLLMLG